MNYFELELELASDTFAEILEAELTELPFESFDRNSQSLKAYIQSEQLDRAALNAILAAYSEEIQKQELRSIEHQNWNAKWESDYQPVIIPGRLFVGAAFHQPTGAEPLVITLDPNMSFGTGHHPTTNMILRWMLDQDLSEQRVFDFGAGSGVLCILASMIGGRGKGIEIDTHAAEAANRNLEINNIDNFTIYSGDLNPAKEPSFGLILANINRNIILERLSILNAMLAPGGRIVCSGFLEEDGPAMSAQMEASGWQKELQTSHEGWLMMVYKKS